MTEPRVTEDELNHLRMLATAASPAPWRSMVEGRDHSSGDSFNMIGREDDRDEDLYLVRHSGRANAADQDFIAAARNYIDPLPDEVKHLRSELQRFSPDA